MWPDTGHWTLDTVSGLSHVYYLLHILLHTSAEREREGGEDMLVILIMFIGTFDKV